jgi:hypothetical protein
MEDLTSRCSRRLAGLFPAALMIKIPKGDSQPRFDSHAPDAHPFGLSVYVAPLPAGSVR